MFVPVSGFAPDADPTSQGVLTGCQGVVPTIRGMKAAPGAVLTTADTLASTSYGGSNNLLLDNSSRLFAGAATKLYELVGTSWTDVSRTVGGVYAAGVSDRWRFAQYGNVSLATNKQSVIQFSNGSGAFENITGSPQASIIETVNDFIFAFDTNEATYADSPDRWWCSALGDYTDWTPAIATQCATGRITSIPGKIRAGKRLGGRIVIYKDRGISVGTYTGPAFIWAFEDIPGDVGAVSDEVVINLETEHYFMSHDGFFRFDGVTVSPIDVDIRNWWVGRVNKTQINLSTALHNRIDGTITWFYPLSGSAVLTEGVVFNYRNGRWGIDDRTIETAFTYALPGVAYDNLGSLYSTYQDLPTVAYDSALFVGGQPSPAFFDTSQKLYTLSGTPMSWDIITGDFGDGQQFSFLSRVIPRFVTSPNSAQLTNRYRASLGDSLTTGNTVSLNRGRFDVYRSAKWHQFGVTGAGAMEILGFDLYFEQDGLE